MLGFDSTVDLHIHSLKSISGWDREIKDLNIVRRRQEEELGDKQRASQKLLILRDEFKTLKDEVAENKAKVADLTGKNEHLKAKVKELKETHRMRSYAECASSTDTDDLNNQIFCIIFFTSVLT